MHGRLAGAATAALIGVACAAGPRGLMSWPEYIARLWASFRPTIALNEGGHPPVQASRELAVRKSGEAGWLRFLAARDDVPVTTLDPSRSEEVAHLGQRFSRQDVKLFFVLRAVSQFRAGSAPGDLEAEMDRVLTIMVALLARQVKGGQRVFAVVGGSHVVMQERALRACIARGARGC